MNNKKMLFLYNPYAGKAKVSNQLHYIVNHFTEHGFAVTVHPTQQENDAYKMTQRVGASYEYVVCAGGDGTLNETVHGLMELKRNRPLLGYIPCGSTNDFATTMGIPANLEKAVDNIVTGNPTYMNIGHLNKQYFTYVAAFGLFTDIPYDTDQGVKNILGHTAYLLEGVKRLGNIQSVHCRIRFGDEFLQDNFIFGMITNSDSVGGFKIPADVLSGRKKGEFYMVLLRYSPKLTDYQGIIAMLLGVKEPDSKFVIRPVEDVEIITPEALAWTLDGEYGGQYTHSHIKIHENRIKIIAPKTDKN